MYVTIIRSRYNELTYFGLFRKVVKAVAHQGEKNPEAKAETPTAEAAPEAAACDFDDLSERNFFNEDLLECDLDLDLDFDKGFYQPRTFTTVLSAYIPLSETFLTLRNAHSTTWTECDGEVSGTHRRVLTSVESCRTNIKPSIS